MYSVQYTVQIHRKNSVIYQVEFWAAGGGFFLFLSFCLRGRFPSLSWNVLQYYTVFLKRIRIIVGDAGFKPGTSAPCAPSGALQMSHHISMSHYMFFSLPMSVLHSEPYVPVCRVCHSERCHTDSNLELMLTQHSLRSYYGAIPPP